MNSGNGSSANGWFDSGYSGTPSVKAILEGGNFIGRGVDDPRRRSDNHSRWRYMIVPCTFNPNDNRRLVMAELEGSQEQTVIQQAESWGCNHSAITTYVNTYRMNYVKMSDAR